MDNHNNVVDTTSNQRFNSSSALYINDRLALEFFFTFIFV